MLIVGKGSENMYTLVGKERGEIAPFRRTLCPLVRPQQHSEWTVVRSKGVPYRWPSYRVPALTCPLKSFVTQGQDDSRI